jgi:putative ABC transport system permease protein
MMQIKDLISKAALAIQAIFGFTLVAGIIVLFAALQSQRAERRRELAILKTIGASRKQLKKTILLEFALVGGIAGFLAGTFAMLGSNIAAYSLFDLQPTFNFTLILLGVVSGALLVGIAGYINLRPLLQVAPAMLFQEHEA